MRPETLMTFTRTTRMMAKGASWTLACGDILACAPDDVYLSLYSIGHRSGLAEVLCRFTSTEDMRTLGQALLDVAAALETASDERQDEEPLACEEEGDVALLHKYQNGGTIVCGVPLPRFYSLTWIGTTCSDCLARRAVTQEPHL